MSASAQMLAFGFDRALRTYEIQENKDFTPEELMGLAEKYADWGDKHHKASEQYETELNDEINRRAEELAQELYKDYVLQEQKLKKAS